MSILDCKNISSYVASILPKWKYTDDVSKISFFIETGICGRWFQWLHISKQSVKRLDWMYLTEPVFLSFFNWKRVYK